MIKVATYCRVSTDQEDQANSFAAQQRYFKEYIARRPEWELYAVYADKGITGTSTKHRTQFNRMIHDACMGRFQLIITKEVSRFSRNILDTISYTRELKALGIGVLFVNDGIHTLEPDAELRLSIMGSIAQEESRKISSRVKWGQTRQMERGIVFGHSMLGYDIKNGQMTINPDGAEIVKLIFYKYGIEKKGTTTIARELREAGYRTCTGNTNWSNSYIIKILKNEKYAGDLVQKKTITPDYLSHARQYNNGEEALVVLHDHHDPIIDRDLWNTVQEERHKRSRHRASGSVQVTRYPFSGKIKCGECGAGFVSRRKYRADGSAYQCWGCFRAANEGKRRADLQENAVGCDVGKLLRDEAITSMMQQSLCVLQIDTDQLIDQTTSLAVEAIQADRIPGMDDERKLRGQVQRVTKKKEDVLDAFFSQIISKEEMQTMNLRYDCELIDLQSRIQSAMQRQNVHSNSEQLRTDIRRRIAAIVRGETESELVYKTILDRITVWKDHTELRLNALPQVFVFHTEIKR